MTKYDMREQTRGAKFKGHLILVTDERGEIIQHSASSPWLYENREQLLKVPVGRYFDETCNRVHPSGPKLFYEAHRFPVLG